MKTTLPRSRGSGSGSGLVPNLVLRSPDCLFLLSSHLGALPRPKTGSNNKRSAQGSGNVFGCCLAQLGGH